MFVLGTAGHVDHGKSTLVRALTGIDPDRLREEKERGMTIDLGFAWLTLPSGRDVSIVDVPGHERFIKNMLAGVGSIDLALLIIAADEGVMPQTREHLAILDLLRVTNGVVVITKRDLVDDEWHDLVRADIEDTIRPTTLARAPIVAVSAVTGGGLPELIARIDAQLDTLTPRADRGRPRLPIDRVFTIAGFGTVVTGALIDGALSVGQEVEVQPSGLASRVRGLQMHRAKVERATPGSRVAVNLAGLATTDLRRGDVLTTPGWLAPSSAFDARIRLVATLDRPVRHNAAVTVHTGAAESVGRVRLLDSDELAPGESGWAQLRLADPIPVVKGDLFIIRSANETLGGGEVIDPQAKRRRRRHDPTLARLAALERGSPDELLVQTLRGNEPIEVAALVRAAPLAEPDARNALALLLRDGAARTLGDREPTGAAWVISTSGWEALRAKAIAALDGYHRQFPLRPGMPKEELKSRLNQSPRLFADTVTSFVRAGDAVDLGQLIKRPTHTPTPTPAQASEAAAFLAALRANPFAPPSDRPIAPDLLAYLLNEGTVVRVADSVLFDAAAYHTMVETVVNMIRANGAVTVAAVRDRFQTSRKYALALLEHLDERKITRRNGDDRVLR